MEPLLQIKNLSLTYEKDQKLIHAVNDVSLDVKKGDAIAIVGESGCGKSTLAKAMIRLLPESAKITEGSVLYEGKDIRTMKKEELRKVRGSDIGMIFQNPMTALNPVMKLRDQIYEVLKSQGMSKEQMKARAIELFEMVGIPAPEKRLNEYIHQYSGGMRQRAMIATVLASNPKILIADEPTTALDVTIQRQIIDLLNDLRKELGMSIILITHDLGVVREMCEQIHVMYAGQIVESADRETIFERPKHPYTKGLLNSLPKRNDTRKRLEPIDGMPPNLAEPIEGCIFADRCPYKDEKCAVSKQELRPVGEGHLAACCKAVAED